MGAYRAALPLGATNMLKLQRTIDGGTVLTPWNISEAAPSLTKKSATDWIHRWHTGYQILVFESDYAARKWATANECEYRE